MDLPNPLESAVDHVQNTEFWIRTDGRILAISDCAINYDTDHIEKSKTNCKLYISVQKVVPVDINLQVL